MRSVPVMEASLDREALRCAEIEANKLGVPLEYYFVEGWRRALWEAMAEKTEWEREEEAREVAARHTGIDENMDRFAEALVRTAESRKSRKRARGFYGH